MTQRIVVLDGYTLNPGDISWKPIAAHGELELYDRTPETLLLDRANGASMILLNKTPLSAEAIEALPDLKYVGVLATGYNVVDIEAAKANGVVVTNIPTYGTDSVAQHVAAFMLEFARRVNVHNTAVHNGEWTNNADWCFALQPMFELTGKTLGIVGIGRIGLAVARIAAAMGMNIIAHDLYWPDADKLQGLEIRNCGLDELFSESDMITLHCPLTAENQQFVNAERLKLMKPSSYIINTSRGPLIDNQALADALNEGTIAGAALDVLDVEPPAAENPLLTAPNCIITPHVAWYAAEARTRLMQIAADNIAAFNDGAPVNVVN
ncbi:MAG: D-2-hydroxyacid dehydrogenase [Pseudomonadota bacterium]